MLTMDMYITQNEKAHCNEGSRKEADIGQRVSRSVSDIWHICLNAPNSGHILETKLINCNLLHIDVAAEVIEP